MRWCALFLIVFIFCAVKLDAFRIARPLLLSHPLNQSQINQLNDTLENLWNLQNGEFNLDIVTTAKTNANNGDFWLIQTGSTVRMQIKANGQVYTLQDLGVD